MQNRFLNSKNIICGILVVIILVGFSVWEYKQTLLIQNFQKTIGIEKVGSEVAISEKPKFFSTSGVSEPLKGVTPLSATEEETISQAIKNQIIELGTTERTAPRRPLIGEETWLNISKFVPRVAKIFCPLDKKGDLYSIGSGVFINSDGNVLTNYHVTQGMVGNECFVAVTSDFRKPPDQIYIARVTNRYDTNIDYMWLYIEKILDSAGNPQELTSRSFPYIPACDSNIVQIGDPIIVLGYPSYGGKTITATDGIISGSIENHFKISAKVDSGNSGGPVLLDDPQYECYVGIATYGLKGTTGYLSYIVKTRAVSGYNW